MKKVKQDSGIILVLVLWVLFFLSIVALTLSFKNRISTRLCSLKNEETRMFYLAYEGISRGIANLAEDNVEFDCLDDEWAQDFSLQKEEGLLSYKVVDEDRFININIAAVEQLNNIRGLIPEISAEYIEEITKVRPFNLSREILNLLEDPVGFWGDESTGKVGLQHLVTVFSDNKVNINRYYFML